jgi:hypothetical protein
MSLQSAEEVQVMATRILGPAGSKKRRRFLFVPILLIACTALFLVGSARAVHDTGLFQLDGDAFQATVPAGSLGGNDDWDSICKANLGTPPSTPGPFCYQAPSTTLDATSSADKSTFITDAFNAGSDNIYKGGTDDADVNTWLWKQATPSPNKADLENAFAAQYTGTAAPYAGHKLLFFGGDRFANNGDTNIGLWFFHNPVTAHGNKAGGTDTSPTCSFNNGCGFSGVHQVGNISLGGSNHEGCNPNPHPLTNICTPGDIFILSAFTGGGAEPTIKVFEWVGPGNATKDYLGSNNCFTNACTLQPLAIPPTPGFTDNRCDGAAVSADVACAIVNPAAIDSPWLFQDQSSGAPANVIGANELYEGGLDLTGLGFGEACFSSVLLNTRSSQSGTSVLQDFALGGFGSCTTDTTTTPKDGSGANIPAGGLSIGTGSVNAKDSATLTVNGVSTWSGTYTFHLCFIGTDTTSTATCTSGGTLIAGSWAGAPNVDQTTATPLVSVSAAVTSAGRYCWRGNFDPSAASLAAGVPAAKDDTGGECFKVNPVTPTLTTCADGTARPCVPDGTVSFGSAVRDTADLSGTANQPGSPVINPTTAGLAAGGTITFKLFGPDTAGSTTHCNDLAAGFPAAGLTATVSGDGVYGPVTFTPQAPGVYHWKASYGGNLPNTNSTSTNASCDDSNEDVTVQQVPTTTTTRQFVFPQDKVKIAASAGGNLAGSVALRLFNNSANCLADDGTSTATGLLYSEGATGDAIQHTISGASAQFATTNNTTVRVTSDTTVYWHVVYSSTNPAQLGSQSNCTESTAVTYAGNDGTITIP